MHVCMYACMYVSIYVCMHRFVCMYVRTYIRTYVRTVYVRNIPFIVSNMPQMETRNGMLHVYLVPSNSLYQITDTNEIINHQFHAASQSI